MKTMTEPFDFPRELRADAVMLEKSHPYTADMLNRCASEVERLGVENERLRTALKDVRASKMPGASRAIATLALNSVST